MGELMEDLAQTALDSALKHGAEFVDIRVEDTKITFIEITDGTSKRSSSGQLKGAGVRAFLNGAWAFAHTTNLTQSGMRDIGLDRSTAVRSAGMTMATRMPSTATTTMSSTSVNPFCRSTD